MGVNGRCRASASTEGFGDGVLEEDAAPGARSSIINRLGSSKREVVASAMPSRSRTMRVTLC